MSDPASRLNAALEGRYRIERELSYAVTSDGERFLMIRSSRGEADNGLIVVENFAEELKARVRN